MKEYTRLESDSIGEMEIPENAYYGVQSLRARENFPITGADACPNDRLQVCFIICFNNWFLFKQAHIMTYHLFFVQIS